MEVEVLIVRREGKVIPKWQQAFGQRPRGHLIIKDERDKELSRITRVARLHRTDAVSERVPDPPPLYDAQIVHACASWLVLTGFERFDPMPGVTPRTDFAQSWVCRDPTSR